MQIAKNCVVSLHYKMYDSDNKLLDETEEPITYLHGGYDGIFPLVEEALHNKNIGDSIDVFMSVEDAFGEQEEELIRVEPLEVFQEDVSVGMVFEADDPETGDLLIFRVIDVSDDKVIVDANHPLAGQAIRFVATVNDIRPANAEEIEHGHIHGEYGSIH